MVYCAHCGTANSASSGYCQICGAILERDLESKDRACPQCSGAVDTDDLYCPHCGTSLVQLASDSVGTADLQAASPEPIGGSQAPNFGMDAGREDLPGWLKDYLGDASEDTTAKSEDQEVWLSDFAELQKNIENSAFLAPDEEDLEQPVDISAWLKNLDLAAEASALVEQLHNTPPDSVLETMPDAEPEEEAELEEAETGMIESVEPQEWERVPQEPAEGMVEEITESSVIEEAQPAERPLEPVDIASEPQPVESVDSEEVAPEPVTPEEIQAEPQPATVAEEPAVPVVEPYTVLEDFTERRVALRNQPVALMVPFKMPPPILPKTPAGEVFADISNPQLSKQGAPVTGVLATSKSRNRLGLMIALALVLIVLLLIAYLYLFQVTDFGFTLGWIGVDLSSLFAG